MRLLVTALVLLCSARPGFADGGQARQAPPLLLWGFQRGCEPLTDSTREVQASLESLGNRSWGQAYVLEPDRRLLGCEGQGCAALVGRSCPLARAPILGGTVEQSSSHAVTRMRLWLFDPQSGQTAFRDDYCQTCDLTSALKLGAAELAQHPAFGVPPSSTPAYCLSEPVAQLAPRGKTFWVVYGNPLLRPAVAAVVRRAVQQVGPELQVQPIGAGREYTLPILKRIVARQPGAQVLVTEVQASGAVELFLYDDATEQTEIGKVQCPGCAREELLEQVRQAAGSLLSRCFGDSCSHLGRSRAPAEACRPFAAPQCGVADPAALWPMPEAVPAAPQPRASRGVARVTKGAVWSIVAAGAVTTLALLAANYSGPGQYQGANFTVTNRLLPAVGASAGLTAVALGVAIPTTIFIERAAAPRPAPISSALPPAPAVHFMQCPNE